MTTQAFSGRLEALDTEVFLWINLKSMCSILIASFLIESKPCQFKQDNFRLFTGHPRVTIKIYFICHNHFQKYSKLKRDIHLPTVKNQRIWWSWLYMGLWHQPSWERAEVPLCSLQKGQYASGEALSLLRKLESAINFPPISPFGTYPNYISIISWAMSKV